MPDSTRPSGKVWSDERQAVYLRENLRSYSWELGKQGWHAWKMCGKLFWQYVWNSVRKILCSLNRPTCSEPSQHNLIFGASPVMQYYFLFCTADAQSEFRHHTIILWIYEILKRRLLCIVLQFKMTLLFDYIYDMVPIYHASLYRANFLPNCNSCYMPVSTYPARPPHAHSRREL